MSNYYVTTYCNFPHRLKDGKPINHECVVLPPAALQAERDDDFPKAVELIEQARPLKIHRGVKDE